jgi:hypothetical protein
VRQFDFAVDAVDDVEGPLAPSFLAMARYSPSDGDAEGADRFLMTSPPGVITDQGVRAVFAALVADSFKVITAARWVMTVGELAGLRGYQAPRTGVA